MSEGVPINPKETRQLMPGERIQLSTPGGGGYGNPRERDRAAVVRDVEFGWVSPGQAREVYGLARIIHEGTVNNPGLLERPISR